MTIVQSMPPAHSVKTNFAKQRETQISQIRGSKEAWERTSLGSKVWIDLENSPHVPFFAPIMKELEKTGLRSGANRQGLFPGV